MRPIPANARSSSLSRGRSDEGNHQLRVAVAWHPMVDRHRPLSALQCGTARHSTTIAVTNSTASRWPPRYSSSCVSACSRSHRGPGREPYHSRTGSRSTFVQAVASSHYPLCGRVKNLHVHQPAVNEKASPIVALDGKRRFQVVLPAHAVGQHAADHFPFDHRVQAIDQNSLQCPPLLCRAVVLSSGVKAKYR